MSDPEASELSHFARLAAGPRPTGSHAADEARRYCGGVLAALGFSVTERPFEYSAFPGKAATPLVGAWLGASIALAALAGMRGRPGVALALMTVAVVVAAIAGRYLATTGVLSFAAMRRRGVNLEATRGAASPAVWLVAHLDSKWQPVPTAARAAGVILLGAATIAALVVGGLQWRTGGAVNAWVPIATMALIGALPVMLSVVGDRGPGAVDNASGVAAVLAAAELLDASASVGVLITDAEELGMAGARAWVAVRREAPGIALNCDGVDDHGRMTMMYSRRRPGAVAAALQQAASDANERLRIMRMIPGILTDSVAFAGAGWATATLSRGSLRTLRRVHTMSDDTAAMRGTGIAVTARVLARAAMDLAARRRT